MIHDNFALLQFKNSFVVNTSSKPDTMDTHCSSFSLQTESWKNSTDCCDWDGVTCDNVSGYVIGLDLSCNNLKGQLHPNSTIFQLRHLQQLNLAFNDFSWSSMHAGIGDLVNLTHLNLSYCHLSGNIPSTISYLSKLVSLDLSSDGQMELILNPFTWKKLIHNVIGELNSLKGLNLSHNGITGTIPQSLRNLEWLDLSTNQLTGEIPVALTNLNFLSFLNLSQNMFEGMIPTSKQFGTFGSDSYEGNANLCGIVDSLCRNHAITMKDNRYLQHQTMKDMHVEQYLG